MTMPAPHTPLWQGFRAQDGSTSPMTTLFNYARIQIADVTVNAQSFYGTNASLLSNAIYCSATFIDRHNFTNQFGLSYGNYWAKDYDPANNSYTSVGNEIGRDCRTVGKRLIIIPDNILSYSPRCFLR